MELARPDPVTRLALEGAAFELLAILGRLKFDRRPMWLKRARDLLHDGFSTPLTLRTISEEVAVHPVHLARTFRRHFGVSVGEYVRRLRVEHAKVLLGSTNHKLSVIAQAAGFADEPHFSRVFRRITGMTPGYFRTSLKKG
jgi:AraC family transcriptional regulator